MLANRYKDDKAISLDNSSKFSHDFFLKDGTRVKLDVPFRTTFLDGNTQGSPSVTDNNHTAYDKKQSFLRYWDSPQSLASVGKEHPLVITEFSDVSCHRGESCLRNYLARV